MVETRNSPRESLIELLQDLEQFDGVEISDQTEIYSRLDSLSLVTLMVDIENLLSDKYSVSTNLVAEMGTHPEALHTLKSLEALTRKLMEKS